MSQSNKTSLFVRAFNQDQSFEERMNLIFELFGPLVELDPSMEPGKNRDIALIPNHEFGGYKNFCFVKVDPEKAEEIVAQLNDERLLPDGITTLLVNIARPKDESPSYKKTGGYGGGSSYGGNSNGGYSNGGGKFGGNNKDRGGFSRDRSSRY